MTIQALDWLDNTDDQSNTVAFLTQLQPHLILGADIIYDPELIEPLCRVIKLALSSSDSSDSSYALLASTVRNENTFAAFLENLGDYNLCLLLLSRLIFTTLTVLDRLHLSAQEITLRRPHINLLNGRLLDGNPSEEMTIELFASAHESLRDGQVRLLQITASSQETEKLSTD